MSKFGKYFYFILATGFAILAIVGTLTSGTSKALERVHARNRGCSVASLKGTYAIRRTGVNNVVGGPIAQISIGFSSGDGTLGFLRTTRSQNGEIRDWTDSPTSGSYTVDPDCTGSFFGLNGTKSGNIVVFDGGKRFFLLSVLPGTITTDEGWRLEVED